MPVMYFTIFWYQIYWSWNRFDKSSHTYYPSIFIR